MNSTRTLLCAAVIAAVAVSAGRSLAAIETERPVVQIALLLDTSNSMDGLINQAKSELWRIVNEFVTAKRNGVRPEFQVALYEYGNNNIPASVGYIRQVVALTTDLDEVSKQLFALKTNGGDEYCGQVIRTAAENLAWSTSNDDLKLIFIAGNEPFTQGTVDYREACRAAIAKGIVINTIFCGRMEEGAATKWQDGALLADGKYLNIDQSRPTVQFEAPQDREIARLGEELNKTYVAYGAQGQAGQARQQAQEANARAMSAGSFVARQVTKASAFYQNAEWDLVDAVRDRKADVAGLKESELPANMQKMGVEERTAYVESQAKRRAELQAQINQLGEERKKHVAQKMKDTAATSNTLDAVMIRTIHEQAAKKNLRFE